VAKRGLVSEKVKATEIVKEHQSYCDTEREIKHFAAETLAYVTPVSELTLLFMFVFVSDSMVQPHIDWDRFRNVSNLV